MSEKYLTGNEDFESVVGKGMGGFWGDQWDKLSTDANNTANDIINKAKQAVGLKTGTDADANGEAGSETSPPPGTAETKKPLPWGWIAGGGAVLLAGFLIFRKKPRKKK